VRSAKPQRPGEPLDLVQGIRAGLAVFEKRREDIVRVAYSRAVRREIDALGRWAASRSVSCVETAEGEMDRLSGSGHHEGLLVTCRPRRWATVQEVANLILRSKGAAIALERVRNPYNIGAILRTAAFFGVDAVVLGAQAPDPGLSGIAVRVAEGGAEHVAIARTTDLAESLARLRALGVAVVGADSEASLSALAFAWARPTILVVGHEREGLTERVRARCDAIVSIPGADRVQSLNVSVATGVLVAQMLLRR
jgi:tRNA G18 (ribose-2'-O)-methylase SpoU